MSERPTPETDAEWDRLQMLPGGGYNSQVAGVKLAFGMAAWASTLERQRDEAMENAQHWCDMHILAVKDFNQARDLARQLQDALQELRDFYVGLTNLPPVAANVALAKAKEVLP